MRIVIDTNVVASAVFFGGKPYQLLRHIMENRVDVVASKEIVDEYEEIVLRLKQKYPDISTKIPLQDFLARFEIIRVTSDIRISRDPDDDKFISCAVDGRCIYIVSGDSDLLSIENYEGIEILTVADFLDRIEKPE
ncbi:MAG: putative toxin-antitoxin system toxin component, PIN family [Bacteroidales bacterium]|nr:putative toxin-antitoxin system toxin component, PIN family [Bacteroidales bacterium]MBR5398367.1 putative toxin-antitoxin system toxin component, PIN family [Bacteroidales bacterium]